MHEWSIMLAELCNCKIENQPTFYKHPLFLVIVQQMIPQRLLRQNLGITNDDEPILRPCQCNVETSWILEEPNTLMFIGSSTRHDDVVFLTTLECIDTGHLYGLLAENEQKY